MTLLAPTPLLEASPVTDDSLEDLVFTAASRVIGVMNGRRDRVYTVGFVYRFLASLPFATSAGVEPPIAPDIKVTLRNGKAVLKANGWTPAFLGNLWNQAETTYRMYARLPDEIVDAFLPEEVRSILAVIVTLGPAAAHDRLVTAIKAYALRPASSGARRGEPVSAGTLSSYYTSGRRFLDVLVDLHNIGYRPAAGSQAEEALAKWTVLPPTINARALSHAENGGEVLRIPPSEELLRRGLARLSDLLALRYRSNGKLRDPTNFKSFRDFILIALVCITGGREGSLFLRPDGPIRVRDYDPTHHFTGTEYVGPALRICVAKKGSAKTQQSQGYKTQWLALPPPIANAIETYLEIVGTRELPDAPLWIKEWADKARTVPNLADPLDVDAFDYIVLKAFKPDVLRGGYRFGPHAIRHTVEPAAAGIGKQWLRGELSLPEHCPKPTETEIVTLNGQEIADALTSHSFSSQDPNGYKHREANRERFALVGSLGMWERLTGELGALKGPDLERRMRADQHYAELQAELAGSDARVTALSDETRRKIRQMAGPAGAGPGANVLLARKWELEHDYMIETARHSSTEIRLAAAREELETAYAAHVALPINWLPERDNETLIRIDEAAIRTRRSAHNIYWHVEKGRLAFVKRGRRYYVTINALRSAGLLEAVGEAPPTEEYPRTSPHLDPGAQRKEEDVPVGARVTLAVAERIFMKSYPTIKRWSVGTMPFPAGDPRNPWQPNSEPTQPPECIEGGFGQRNKRLIVTPELALWLRRHPLVRERFALALQGRL